MRKWRFERTGGGGWGGPRLLYRLGPAAVRYGFGNDSDIEIHCNAYTGSVEFYTTIHVGDVRPVLGEDGWGSAKETLDTALAEARKGLETILTRVKAVKPPSKKQITALARAYTRYEERQRAKEATRKKKKRYRTRFSRPARTRSR